MLRGTVGSPSRQDPIVWLQVGCVVRRAFLFFFLIVAKKKKKRMWFVRKPTNETTIIHNHENNDKYRMKLKITSPAVTRMTCNKYSLCMQDAFVCLPRAFFPNHHHPAAHQAEFANLTALVIASKHAAKDLRWDIRLPSTTRRYTKWSRVCLKVHPASPWNKNPACLAWNHSTREAEGLRWPRRNWAAQRAEAFV